MKRARQGGDNALTCRLGVAFALAIASLIPVAPASAQTPAAATCVTAACASAQQGQLTSPLSPFTSPAGTNALSASFQLHGALARPTDH